MVINITELPVPEKQQWLQHAVAPRPICLASTIDAKGNANLSPFSFFNLFSANPPIVIFSPSRKGRDNTFKHTLLNVQEHAEVVINMCNEAMVQQMSLSSCEFERGVDEFIKAGFTKEAATKVQPPMVKEAHIKLECLVKEIKSLGEQGGAGQLVIAEVLCMHVDDNLLNNDGKMIDQTKTDFVARLGGDWYCSINNSNMFTVAKPNTNVAIGIDALPTGIKKSKVLTGNQLAQLANVQELPIIDASFTDDTLKNIVQYYSINPDEMEYELHCYAAKLLNNNEVKAAWQILLSVENTFLHD